MPQFNHDTSLSSSSPRKDFLHPLDDNTLQDQLGIQEVEHQNIPQDGPLLSEDTAGHQEESDDFLANISAEEKLKWAFRLYGKKTDCTRERKRGGSHSSNDIPV